MTVTAAVTTAGSVIAMALAVALHAQVVKALRAVRWRQCSYLTQGTSRLPACPQLDALVQWQRWCMWAQHGPQCPLN